MLGLLSTVSGAVGSSAGTLSQIPFTVAGMSADAGGALVGAIVPSPFLAISQVFSMLSSSFSSLVTSPSQLARARLRMYCLTSSWASFRTFCRLYPA